MENGKIVEVIYVEPINLTPAPPDENCFTMPDGECVGELQCMHSPQEVRVGTRT